jgi:hypothetical protein
MFPLILSQIFAKIRRWRRARKGKSLKIRPGELMAPWTFEVKFPYGTQFLFGTLMFTAGEDRTIELLTHSPSPSHHELIYGEAPYYPVDPSTTLALGGTRSGLNPYAGSYAPIAMTSWGTRSRLQWPGPRPKHRALLHQAHLPVGTRLKITLRLWAASIGTLPSRPTVSAWWVPPERLPIIVQIDIQRDQGI